MTNLPPNTVKLFGPNLVSAFEVITMAALGQVSTLVTTVEKEPLSVQQDVETGFITVRALYTGEVVYTFSLASFVCIAPVEYIVEDTDYTDYTDGEPF